MTDKYPDVAALMKRIQRRLSPSSSSAAAVAAASASVPQGEKGEEEGNKESKEGGALQVRAQAPSALKLSPLHLLRMRMTIRRHRTVTHDHRMYPQNRT